MRIESVPFDHPDAVALRAAQEAFGDELYASDPASKQRARDEGVPRVVIRTGDRQHAALRLYERHGCTPIDVVPPYEAVTD